MKTKIIMIAIASMGIILTSCSSDDDNNNECTADYIGELSTTEEKLVGTWILTAIEAEDEIDLTDDDTENPSTDLFAQVSECAKDFVYTFNSEREMEILERTRATGCSNEIESIHQWKLDGNILSFISNCQAIDQELDFSDDESAFSVESNLIIEDVEGENITTTVTYVYTKEEN